MTRLVLRGIERANSTEPADVIKALEGWETEDWPGKVWINPKTHQTVRDFFFLRCKRPEEMNNPHDYGEIVAMGSTPFMPDEFNLPQPHCFVAPRLAMTGLRVRAWKIRGVGPPGKRGQLRGMHIAVA